MTEKAKGSSLFLSPSIGFPLEALVLYMLTRLHHSTYNSTVTKQAFLYNLSLSLSLLSLSPQFRLAYLYLCHENGMPLYCGGLRV